MTDLRTVAQQALDDLKDLQANHNITYAGTISRLEAALAQEQAEPTVKESLKVAPAVAKNATTEQQVGETPPSDYRRGYWDGFNIGKREGRIEAEDAAKQVEPVQKPVAWALHTGTRQGIKWNRKVEHGTPLYTAPPKLVPLTDEEAAKACGASGTLGPLMQIVRAVERALEEKNRGR